ncbi:MAG TPA: hypothetical protein PKI19_12790, partial [Elusimicrobiales bacterium]|nr:hypothetical protein [Elusimicrobiales bacterium]
KGKNLFCPVINCAHPFIKTLAALHATRPGFASFLLLKAMLLQQDGSMRSDAESAASNLEEKRERRLLNAAMKLDLSPADGDPGGRNG